MPDDLCTAPCQRALKCLGKKTCRSKSEERSKLLMDPAVTSIAYEGNKHMQPCWPKPH